MKIAVTDYSFDSLDFEKAILEPLGCEVVDAQCRTPQETMKLTHDCDGVISQYAPINADVIGAMQKVRVIARYGIGVDNVDIAAARAKGIAVCNVPDYCINEVADHTLALMLCATRCLVSDNANVHAGNWKASVPAPSMKSLDQCKVGVAGFGRIGRQVVQRLLAFGGEILVFDPVAPLADIEKSGARAASLDEIFGCDIVTLHCPSTDQTRKMVNAQSLAKMPRGAILVNVSRGDLVDSEALAQTVKSGQIGAAALDVLDEEPPPEKHPLLGLGNVIVTPHVASVSARSVRVLRESTAEAVARAVRGEKLLNVVNGVE